MTDLMAFQTGWQDSICRLLIHHPITRPDSTSTLEVPEEYKLSEERMSSSKNSKNSSFDIDSKGKSGRKNCLNLCS